MYPSREEFTELIYYISELKHQYGSKIDEQTIKINDQSGVIEELLWQIRELSDKIRQMNNKVMDLEKTLFESRRKSEDKYCVCRYENHIPRRHNRSVFSRHASTISRRDTHKIIMKQVDKTVDDDGNDVYEDIELSDSSNVYTEPIRDYGVLRKTSIKTSPKQHKPNKNKPPSGLKKSAGAKNLNELNKKFAAMEDVSKTNTDDENDTSVELRSKALSPQTKRHDDGKPSNSLTTDADREFILTTSLDNSIQQRDVSGILINFGCLSSRTKNDFCERVSY